MKPIFVHIELEEGPLLVGRLWSRIRQSRESATFDYDSAWLRHPRRFMLEPALHLGPGPQHTAADQAIFGALGDSAPDRWGRTLMRQGERRRAASAFALVANHRRSPLSRRADVRAARSHHTSVSPKSRSR